MLREEVEEISLPLPFFQPTTAKDQPIKAGWDIPEKVQIKCT